MMEEGRRVGRRRCAWVLDDLQLVLGVDDTVCEVCGTEGWPRLATVLLPLMWGEELPLRG